MHGALAALGSRGLVGLDVAEGCDFHREPPFDPTLVESLHPRLLDARKLVAFGGVRITWCDDARIQALASGTDFDHRIGIVDEIASHTCPRSGKITASGGIASTFWRFSSS